jgi:hypothetical protein
MVRLAKVRHSHFNGGNVAVAVKTSNGKERVNYDAEQTTSGGNETISLTEPYTAQVLISGVAPLLFHAWNCEAVEEKSKAAKGSKAKKSDNIESYLYRTPDGRLGLPGKNFHATLIEAGRWSQDPRSPRKSLRDLVRAAVVPLDAIAPFIPDTTHYDYEDKQRVTVQRNGITRVRPAMQSGWRIRFRVLITLPEYLALPQLAKLITDAGRMVGLCDYRPTYGRFATEGLTVETLD